MKNGVVLILLILTVNVGFCRSYFVHNEAEFNQSAKLLRPGDTIVIANGFYEPWAVVVNKSATALSPITITSESPGKVVFSGKVTKPVFKISGSYITLAGIVFSKCSIAKDYKQTGLLIALSAANNCRITGCEFSENEALSQYLPIVIVSGNGARNKIDSCTFKSNINNQDIQVKITSSTSPTNTIIENNIFKDKKKVTWLEVNGGECIQIGQNSVVLGGIKSYTTVSGNKFVRCNGEAEIISNKSSNNTYIKNSFEDCNGELVMRGGNDCIIDGNLISRGKCGIRVSGTGHQIINNQINNVNVGIRLLYGMAHGRKAIGFYVAATQCVVKYNKFENVTTGILTGDRKNMDWADKFDVKVYPSRTKQDVSPKQNTISNNTFTNVKVNVVN